MPKYFGDFADVNWDGTVEPGWARVSDAFEIDIPEPDVLFAAYEAEGYEGYAYVLYAEDGKFYEVNGSHCSCYGLEGQWEPEETTLEAVEHCLRNGRGYGPQNDRKLDIYDVIKSRRD